jgi:hypothetical protein
MHTRFEFRHILAPCANGYPKCYSLEDQTIPNPHPKSCGKFETFSSGLCMQHSFIAVKTDPCTCACIWFSHLSLIPDVCPRIHDRWCAGVDSLELPRGGWFSCTFVGHPKRLWVHRVPIVLGTWAHDHRPTASLGSEGEDPCVPDTSYLGRVGGEGTRVELGWHRANRPGQNTLYPLPVPELPESEPELPEPEVPDPKFG